MNTPTLTPEQRARLAEYSDKWSRIAASTEDVNRLRAETLIKRLYEVAGLKAPAIMWTEDLPSGLAVAMLFTLGNEHRLSRACEMFRQQMRVHAAPTDESFDERGRKVSKIIDSCHAARQNVSECLSDEPMQIILNNYWTQLTEHIPSTIVNEIRFADGSERTAIMLPVIGRLENEFTIRMNDIYISIEEGWEDQTLTKGLLFPVMILEISLKIAMRNWFTETIEAGLPTFRAMLLRMITLSIWGPTNIDLCYGITVARTLDFARQELDVPLDPVLMELSANVGWWWALPDVCVVCERPKHLTVDASGRLHHENAPAVEYASGQKIYAWHGIPVRENFVVNPTTITLKDVEDERNVEVRRALIQRYKSGPADYLRDSGALLVHEDKYGKLWRKARAGDSPLEMVEVVNATPEADGSCKTYFLRVKPGFHTAKAAIAWTFGLSDREYEPLIES